MSMDIEEIFLLPNVGKSLGSFNTVKNTFLAKN